jgi:molecular chaperone HtpG
VPDQEVLLKKRVESDEANRRMAGAALRLARMYTGSVDDTVVAKLYVNLDSPAIQGLLALKGDVERSRTGADLLRAIAALTAGSGEASATVDVPASLAAYTAAVCRVLEKA